MLYVLVPPGNKGNKWPANMIRQYPSAANRILIAEMDSIAQRARYDTKDHHVATTELSGMLRIGRLVSEHILLTDAMVLDGSYFMRLGPEGVIRELGATEAQFPLTITGHYSSLREGLEVRLANADFVWSLENFRQGHEAPSSITNTWQQWLDYVERGIVRYEQQNGQFILPAGARYPLKHAGADQLQATLDQTTGQRRGLCNDPRSTTGRKRTRTYPQLVEHPLLGWDFTGYRCRLAQLRTHR